MESSPTSGTDRDSKRLKLSTELDGSLSSQSTVDVSKMNRIESFVDLFLLVTKIRGVTVEFIG